MADTGGGNNCTMVGISRVNTLAQTSIKCANLAAYAETRGQTIVVVLRKETDITELLAWSDVGMSDEGQKHSFN